MKVKGFLLFFLLVGLFSCSEEDKENAELIGEWQLKEVMVDPGDGSGQFRPVESDKVVKFYSNGEVWSNYSLCGIYATRESSASGSGTYSFTDSIIKVNNCDFYGPYVGWPFYIKGDTLTISYLCIEGCGEKYVKR